MVELIFLCPKNSFTISKETPFSSKIVVAQVCLAMWWYRLNKCCLSTTLNTNKQSVMVTRDIRKCLEQLKNNYPSVAKQIKMLETKLYLMRLEKEFKSNS